MMSNRNRMSRLTSNVSQRENETPGAAERNDNIAKLKAKQYTDKRRKARLDDLTIGESVFVK